MKLNIGLSVVAYRCDVCCAVLKSGVRIAAVCPVSNVPAGGGGGGGGVILIVLIGLMCPPSFQLGLLVSWPLAVGLSASDVTSRIGHSIAAPNSVEVAPDILV